MFVLGFRAVLQAAGGPPVPEVGRVAPHRSYAEIEDLAATHGAREPDALPKRATSSTQIGPTAVERKTLEYPARRKGVKTGPCRRLSVRAGCSTHRLIARGGIRSPDPPSRSAHIPGRGLAHQRRAFPWSDALRGRLRSGVHLPLAVNRFVARFGLAPLHDRRLPVGVRRRLLDLSGLAAPLPRGTRRASGLLGGVPTVVTSAVDPTSVGHGAHRVLYLHGGGYQVSSPTTYRGLIAHLSRATGAPVHAPVYRLAPSIPTRRGWKTRSPPSARCSPPDTRHNASRWSAIPPGRAWRCRWSCGSGRRERSGQAPSG